MLKILSGLCMMFAITAQGETLYKCMDHGQISYQQKPCEAKQKEIGILSLRNQPVPEIAADNAGKKPVSADGGFKKDRASPTITLFYNPANEPTGVAIQNIEPVIREAAAKWNNGCNVNLVYGGVRKGNVPEEQRARDGYTINWDRSLNEISNNGLGAAGAASPDAGVKLNPKSIHSPEQLKRVVTHEIGHIIGIGHIHEDRNSVMSYLSDTQTQFAANPNASDYLSCNLAIRQKFGIQFDEPKSYKKPEITDEQAANQLKNQSKQ